MKKFSNLALLGVAVLLTVTSVGCYTPFELLFYILHMLFGYGG